ncbi:ABC transporter permease [Catenulispora subtropica]|uniref:FtsX-like permease family protein n=1 Tax=Catenulispora subtropica TaxID=450798 RepID=A0ABP5BP32_9ACTN
MSAVWRASRAAVKRRRLQTFTLGVVVMVSSMMAVATLSLLAAISGPFDKAFNAAHGAHIVAEYDRAKVTETQLAQTAHASGVTEASGPYPLAVLNHPAMVGGRPIGLAGSFTAVGRDRPDSAVDKLQLSSGRWAAAPDEIVLNMPKDLGAQQIRYDSRVTLADGTSLKVVGYASSASNSADGWVTPAEAKALGATSEQMLYRFSDAGSDTALTKDMATATKDLPSGSLTGTSSYLGIKANLAKGPGTYLPFLTVFGILGLLVSVLIVGNVVSGAVVSGYRHIGVLKALGFTPDQVTGVYLTMVTFPAVLGCAVGTAVGSVVGEKLVHQAFWGIFNNDLVLADTSVPAWIYPAVLIGMPVLVAVSALIPALKARRLPAAVAISAGSVQQTGRGLAVQRRLGRSGLPRPVSLGLGWPFARPGRTALTLSTVVLGVTTVTMAIGLSASVVKYGDVQKQTDRIQVSVAVDNPKFGQTAPAHSDDQLFALLRSMPGAVHVSADTPLQTRMAGYPGVVRMAVETGDTDALHPDLVHGRWPSGPGEVVVDSEFWHAHGAALGQTITLDDSDGRPRSETIVGETAGGWDITSTDWDHFAKLGPSGRAATFSVGLSKGTNPQSFAAAVRKADPGIQASVNGGTDTMQKVMVSVISSLTVMLMIVAALGVFNTVVLNTRERRKDLGMLKAVGMTPRQVVTMVVISMAALGLVGGVVGVPLGMAVHRIVIPLTGHSTHLDLPSSLLHVWDWRMLALLGLSGAVIGALGAWLPSIRAAKAPVAEVLRTE